MAQTILDVKQGIKGSTGISTMPANSKYTSAELKERMVKVMEEQPYAALRYLCFNSNWKTGDEKQYISQIVELEKIPCIGAAIFIAAPTGSGKTKAVNKIIKNTDTDIVYLTNREATLKQFKKDYLKEFHSIDANMDHIDQYSLGENVTAMTYQKFAASSYKYKDKQYMMILDEIHCLLEDATFSTYPEKVARYIKANLDNTSRIYITATPEAVALVIDEIECKKKTSEPLPVMTWETSTREVIDIYTQHKTRINMVYSVQSNWDYIDFKFYSPDDIRELTDYIKGANEKNIKSFIFINDISKGKMLQAELGNTQHIFSDADKREEIAKIAKNECFSESNLVSTKVAENGLSLHDNELNLIVAETLDPVTLQQVIGRARINKKNNQRIITVLIPDYSPNDIGNAIASMSYQLKKAKEVAENPGNALEYAEEHPALVYYDSKAKKPVANSMMVKALEYQIDFLRELKLTGDRHAFAKKVLEIYGRKPAVTDDMFISYDRILSFKTKVSSAFDEYQDSEMTYESLEKLKEALKDACNSTRAYNDGKIISSSIQIGTINDILKAADISYKVNPKIEIYTISAI